MHEDCHDHDCVWSYPLSGTWHALVLHEPNDKANRLRWWLVSNAVSLTPWCSSQWQRGTRGWPSVRGGTQTVAINSYEPSRTVLVRLSTDKRIL